jgi:hypothetical protein
MNLRYCPVAAVQEVVFQFLPQSDALLRLRLLSSPPGLVRLAGSVLEAPLTPTLQLLGQYLFLFVEQLLDSV